MPSFKLWFVSAVLFAIVFPQSTVFAQKDPANKSIVGSWKVTFALDPKKVEAERAKTEKARLSKAEKASEQKSLNLQYLMELYLETIYEFRADGSLAMTFTETEKEVGTWKLVDKGETKLELEMTDELGKKTVLNLSGISKDEFTFELPKEPKDALSDTFITGVRFHRKKEPIVFPRSTVVGSWKMAPTFHPVVAPASAMKLYASMYENASIEFRADGSFTEASLGTETEGNWKLVDKGEKGLVLERGKEDLRLTWISKDQFTGDSSVQRLHDSGYRKGFHFHRIKDAPKP